jgi:hypothetical protein
VVAGGNEVVSDKGSASQTVVSVTVFNGDPNALILRNGTGWLLRLLAEGECLSKE